MVERQALTEMSLSQIDVRKIEHLSRKHETEHGRFTVIPVGEVGALVQSDRRKPQPGKDWFMFDFDDTLGTTTEAKAERKRRYKEYVDEKTNGQITEIAIDQAMHLTDQFSRWEDKPGKGKAVHAYGHVLSLSWATTALIQSVRDGKDESETVKFIEETLHRVQGQLDGQEIVSSDPFYFQPATRKLLSKQKGIWSKPIEQIFTETVINPSAYAETEELGKLLAVREDVNVGVFSAGEPYIQATKLFELMKEHPEFPVSQLWLTRIRKGAFVEEMVKTNASRTLAQEAGSEEGGYPLGTHPHVITMFDDSPTELTSLLNVNSFLEDSTGASFAVVRSRRPGTRDVNKAWELQKPGLYQVADFTTEEPSGKRIVGLLDQERVRERKNRRLLR